MSDDEQTPKVKSKSSSSKRAKKSHVSAAADPDELPSPAVGPSSDDDMLAVLEKTEQQVAAYDGMKASREANKRKRRSGDDSSSDDNSSGSDSESSSDDEKPDDTPAAAAAEQVDDGADVDADAGAASSSGSGLVLRRPNRNVVRAYEEPPLEYFNNPNITVSCFSRKHRLFIHYTEISPKKHLRLSASKPKAGYTSVFVRVTCAREQKFDFTGGSKFTQVHWTNAFTCIGPFAVASFPRMWPHGDRFPMKNSKYPPPATVGKIKYKCPLVNAAYSESLESERESSVAVDDDADQFMNTWMLEFDAWAGDESFKQSSACFPIRRKEFLDAIEKKIQDKVSQYNADMKKYNSAKDKDKPKSKPKEVKTDNQEIEKKLRKKFLEDGIKKMVSLKDGMSSLTCSTPVLRNETQKESADKVPYSPPDEWFREMYTNPPNFVDSAGNSKDGNKRKAVSLPLFAAITRKQAQADHEAGLTGRKVPWRLVPPEDSFIAKDDVVAPIFQLEPFDSKPGAGYRCLAVGYIWLGEKGKLNDQLDPLPGVDPTTYFVCAQDYTRTKATYKPYTVEDSPAAAGGY